MRWGGARSRCCQLKGKQNCYGANDDNIFLFCEKIEAILEMCCQLSGRGESTSRKIQPAFRQPFTSCSYFNYRERITVACSISESVLLHKCVFPSASVRSSHTDLLAGSSFTSWLHSPQNPRCMLPPSTVGVFKASDSFFCGFSEIPRRQPSFMVLKLATTRKCSKGISLKVMAQFPEIICRCCCVVQWPGTIVK